MNRVVWVADQVCIDRGWRAALAIISSGWVAPTSQREARCSGRALPLGAISRRGGLGKNYVAAAQHGPRSMILRTSLAIFAAALSCFGMLSAQAGPCGSDIARFEQAVRQSAGNPNAGPIAPQTIGAQLDREPTPSSIRRAQARARAAFGAQLAHAKRLDARGDRGCAGALARAEDMYNLH